MPVSALAAARRMCERSDWSLTNLELQKLLYIAQMVYLGQNKKRLINDIFQAWDYGPVLHSVYSQVKTFGSGPIRNVFHRVGSIHDAEIGKWLDDAYDQLSSRSAGELVNITHWSKGAWARNYVPGVRGIEIPDSHIVDEYNARNAKIKAKA